MKNATQYCLLALKRRGARWMTGSAAMAALLLCGSAATAQTYVCPPPPEGVYGLPGGPKFAEPTLPDTFASQLDDPRWNGAWREDFSTASSSEAGVRMLKEGDFLFVSFEAKVDPNNAAANSDAIYLGFSRNGTTAEMVKIVMSAGPPLQNSPSISSINWWKTTDGGATWPKQGGPLSWARSTNIHAWADPGSSGTANGYSWAINAKIDLGPTTGSVGDHLDGGGALSSNFFMWYEINIQTTGSPIPYDWPAGSATLTFDATSGAALGLPVSAWGNAYPTVTTNCPTGVSIDPMRIGILPLMAPGMPSTYPVHFGTGHAANDFVAEVDDGAATLPNNSVKGRFRIANWGSTIGVGGDWHDMAPLATCAVPGKCDNIGNEVKFHCVNPPDSSDTVCYQPGGAPSDQCLLVQLEQENGSGIKFVHDSARRNLDFVDASKFDRDAEISIRDAAPLPGSTGTRDVYLYVRTLHMPDSVDGNHPIEVPPPVPPVDPRVPGKENSPNRPNAPKDNGPPRYRMDTYERYASVMPTYEVHVYHDTGRTRTEDGHTMKVLEPQAPFGYFVRHAGDLAGWKHALTGQGFVLEEISPNFYHAKIPDNGSIKVHTHIGTCEHYVFGLFKCCCTLTQTRGGTREGAYAGLGFGLLVALRRRSRPRHGRVQRN